MRKKVRRRPWKPEQAILEHKCRSVAVASAYSPVSSIRPGFALVYYLTGIPNPNGRVWMPCLGYVDNSIEKSRRDAEINGFRYRHSRRRDAFMNDSGRNRPHQDDIPSLGPHKNDLAPDVVIWIGYESN